MQHRTVILKGRSISEVLENRSRGADVHIIKTDKQQQTDEKGVFRFTELPEGTYVFIITHPSEAISTKVSIDINSGDMTEVKIHLGAAFKLETVVVEATVLVPTLRRNQKQQYPERFRKLQVRMRWRIETTIGQLTQQFHVSRLRALKHWGLLTRMSNKLGSCLLGAFINQCLGRPLMKLKDLVLA